MIKNRYYTFWTVKHTIFIQHTVENMHIENYVNEKK